jgi:N-acyl-D-amino-acid deacylase
MRKFVRGKYALLAIVLFAWLGTSSSQQKPGAVVIINAQIADGTGKPLRKGSVRISGDRITQVGDFRPAKDEEVIDAKGLVLAPGFIDIHNHSTKGLESDPLAETQIAQGITTLVVGADGDSPWPIAPWLKARDANPASLNVAVMAGHATIREQILGKDFKRVSTPAEVEKNGSACGPGHARRRNRSIQRSRV